MGIFFISCEEEEEEGLDESLPVNPVLNPIKTVMAQDGNEIAYATINNKDRTIKLSLKHLKSLSAVNVHLSISKRAKLISPTDTILTLDLTEPYQIIINDLYEDLTYTLTATIPEYILIDKSAFREYRLNNDSPKKEGEIEYLWNNEVMTQPNSYSTIGYRNYLTGKCFTVDLGDHYYIKQFTAHLYWAYTNVCPKIYELWGYLKDGEPPVDGNWNDWTLLGTLDNSNSTLSDFPNGDTLEFPKENSPRTRYIRVNCIQSWKGTTDISLCEITIWAWNI